MVNKMRIELFHEKYIDEMIFLFKESIRKICIKYYSPIQIEAWLSRANKTRWISYLNKIIHYLCLTKKY